MKFGAWKYDPKAIGRRIDEGIEATKLKKKDFARIIGKHQTTVSSWAKGERINKIEVLGRIAETLGCSVDYLIGLDTQQEDTSMFDLKDPKHRKAFELIFEIKALLPDLDETAIDNIRTAVDFWKFRTKRKEPDPAC